MLIIVGVGQHASALKFAVRKLPHIEFRNFPTEWNVSSQLQRDSSGDGPGAPHDRHDKRNPNPNKDRAALGGQWWALRLSHCLMGLRRPLPCRERLSPGSKVVVRAVNQTDHSNSVNVITINFELNLRQTDGCMAADHHTVT